MFARIDATQERAQRDLWDNNRHEILKTLRAVIRQKEYLEVNLAKMRLQLAKQEQYIEKLQTALMDCGLLSASAFDDEMEPESEADPNGASKPVNG